MCARTAGLSVLWLAVVVGVTSVCSSPQAVWHGSVEKALGDSLAALLVMVAGGLAVCVRRGGFVAELLCACVVGFLAVLWPVVVDGCGVTSVRSSSQAVWHGPVRKPSGASLASPLAAALVAGGPAVCVAWWICC